MSRELRGIKGKDAIKAFIHAGGIERPGKGDHVNIKMPNGMIVTIPDKGELKIGLFEKCYFEGGSNRGTISRITLNDLLYVQSTN
jgi:predicted RNA binding protein YcfA (HicA-like mRNA interferase family)